MIPPRIDHKPRLSGVCCFWSRGAEAREVGMTPERGQAGMCACPGSLAC